MASLIGIGLSGINAHQAALKTTGQNITNANTPGYSRQEVVFNTSPTLPASAGYQGAGVVVDDIRRQNDEFVNGQLRSDTSLFSGQDTLLKELKDLDNFLGGESTGLNTSLNNFFSSLQSAADSPASIPERQLVISRANALAQRFSDLDTRLTQQKTVVDQQLAGHVSEINGLSKSIGELNAAINGAAGANQGRLPNDLVDQRDEALRHLSELIQVQVVNQGNQTNVLTAGGQTLVLGTDVRTIEMQRSPKDSTRQQLVLNNGKGTQDITSDIVGGKVGGLLHFRDKVLEPAFGSIGRIALAVADNFNQLHQRGMDLEGNLGGDFFSDINGREAMLGRVQGNANNAQPNDRVVSIEITDTALLPVGNFVLEFTGPANTQYAVRRAEDGKIMQNGMLNGAYPAEINMPGFSIALESGNFQRGDSFLVKPSATGIANFKVELGRPETLAFAQPLRAEAQSGNEGNGSITQGVILDFEHPITHQVLSRFGTDGNQPPPYVVKFVTPTVYDVLQPDPADPSRLIPLDPPVTNQTYTPGVSNKLFSADTEASQVRMGGLALGTLGTAGNNGYQAQNLEFRTRDPLTGGYTNQTVPLGPDGVSARTMAIALNSVPGAKATAYTSLGVNFNSFPPGPVSLNLTVAGKNLNLNSIPASDFRPENLVDAINQNPEFQALGLIATVDKRQLVIRSTQGDDINVSFTGVAAGNVTLNKDPYGNGSGAMARPVVPGVVYTAGGVVDLQMTGGMTVHPADDDGDEQGELFVINPNAQLNYRGIQFDVSGRPASGDTFDIRFNRDGASDNRIALALAQLSGKSVLNDGTTFNKGYTQLVGNVGVQTHSVMLDQEASKTLLSQSEGRWQEKSGVNMDEEAGRLIQYQAAYNASAQVVSIARELFDTLLNTFR